MTAYTLNLIDLIFTLHALECGAVEANPLMRLLMEIHPLALPFVKVVVAGALFWWLHRRAKTSAFARRCQRVITAVYAAFCVWNLIIIILLGGFSL